MSVGLDYAYLAFYFEVYLFVSSALLLRTKFKATNPAFIFWIAYSVLLALGPVIYTIFRPSFVFRYDPLQMILLPFGLFVVGNYLLFRNKSKERVKSKIDHSNIGIRRGFLTVPLF